MIEEGTADVVAALIAMVEAQTEAVESKGAEWVRNVQLEGTDQISAVQTAGKNAESDAVAEIEAKGVNTRNSIPADYTALSEAVDSVVRGKAPGIVCSAEGSAITVNDASDNYMQGLRIFGKSTQDGAPTPDAPVEIVSVENPTISVNEQTLNIPRTLPGIPVTSGGNYTDSDGQQWICDEVDLERGVYVQRIRVVDIASHGTGVTGLNNGGNGLIISTPYKVKKGGYGLICTHAPFDPIRTFTEGTIYENEGNAVICGNSADTFDTLKETYGSATLHYALATPIETALSETEIAAYRALHSNYPNTTVLNDAGAHMVVKYAADTRLYVDNKIAALIGG
jgi:hypothetical protein